MNLDTSKPIKSVSYNGVDVPLFQEAPVLLWTNASPTSAFAAQTVTVASGYSAYLIELWHMTTGANYSVFFVAVGAKKSYHATTSGLTGSCNREITPNASSIVFGKGYNSSGNAVNNVAIPTRIWGVKFTL